MHRLVKDAHGQLTKGGRGHHIESQGDGQVHVKVWGGGVAEYRQLRGGGGIAKVKDGYEGCKTQEELYETEDDGS